MTLEIETAQAEVSQQFDSSNLSLPLQPNDSSVTVPTVLFDNYDSFVDNTTGAGSIHNTPGVAFQEEPGSSYIRPLLCDETKVRFSIMCSFWMTQRDWLDHSYLRYNVISIIFTTLNVFDGIRVPASGNSQPPDLREIWVRFDSDLSAFLNQSDCDIWRHLLSHWLITLFDWQLHVYDSGDVILRYHFIQTQHTQIHTDTHT